MVGEWGVCEPLGGYGACGAGVSRRSVQCFDDEDYPQSLDNCEHGLTTAAEMSCTVDCPILLVAGAIPHPGFFGVLRWCQPALIHEHLFVIRVIVIVNPWTCGLRLS